MEASASVAYNVTCGDVVSAVAVPTAAPSVALAEVPEDTQDADLSHVAFRDSLIFKGEKTFLHMHYMLSLQNRPSVQRYFALEKKATASLLSIREWANLYTWMGESSQIGDELAKDFICGECSGVKTCLAKDGVRTFCRVFGSALDRRAKYIAAKGEETRILLSTVAT